MSLIFYRAPMSTAVMTHWILEELAVPYESVTIDLQSGELRKPEYLAMNPNGLVPLIVHDGTPIFESAAIVIYLGETFGVDKGLFPAPGPQRGEALKWIVWTNVSLAREFYRYQASSSQRSPTECHNAAQAAAALANVEGMLGVLDKLLATRQFLVGDAFSLVDCHVAAYATYLTFGGIDLARWPNVDAWRGRACSRPAFAKVMAS